MEEYPKNRNRFFAEGAAGRGDRQSLLSGKVDTLKIKIQNTFLKDTLMDLLGGFLVSVGIYNFAANAGFLLAGISGIALILYRLAGVPIGMAVILMNVPIAAICYKILGKKFFVRSLRTMVTVSLMTDYVAPLLPVYPGERLLAAICTGVFTGLGYALVFMNGSSTGGMDFISMSIRARRPHLSLGRIVFVLDCAVVLFGAVLFRDMDGAIYGLIITWLMTLVIDKIMYGIDSGKMTLIVTEKGKQVAVQIDQYVRRGSTLMEGYGSHTGALKQVVMCACSKKQMYIIRRMVKQIDPGAFMIIMESNEVVGEGFKKE